MSAMSAINQQLESVLECPLCMCLICEPITISCGHSFCRVCLVKSLRMHKKKCPTCRAVCHVSAESAEESILIKNICLALFPNEYQARVQDTEEERSTWENVMPIFYYNDCQFPGYILRLHLFEPRYKLMMQRVVNSNRCFAYVPNFRSYNARVGDIALVASLTEAEFLPDGRCIIEAKLTARKVITDHYVEEGTQGLHFCRLGPLKDYPLPAIEGSAPSASNVQGLAAVVYSIGRQLYERNRRQFDYTMGEPPRAEDPEALSLWMCMLVPMNTQAKMRLLTSTDTTDRLETVLRQFSTSGIRPTTEGADNQEGEEEAPANTVTMVRTLETAVATIRAALSGGNVNPGMLFGMLRHDGDADANAVGGADGDDNRGTDDVNTNGTEADFIVAEESFPYEDGENDDEDEYAEGDGDDEEDEAWEETLSSRHDAAQEEEEEEDHTFHDPRGIDSLQQVETSTQPSAVVDNETMTDGYAHIE